ncbi:hypothetical protein [Mesorhizobium sp.]|uniref:hypothetical protein n=1 Tax=Mesorhizobium sp. TaxID=1871066 RepID=UPI0025E5E5CB|nr:hypothetical protein [Mesorhizobium sp.]
MRQLQSPHINDNLATATQLEVNLALTVWQHNRAKAPAERLNDYDECVRDRAYETLLSTVSIAMTETVPA